MRTEADIAQIVREVLDDLGKGTQYGEAQHVDAQHENVQYGAVQHENVRRSGAHPKATGGTARFAGEASARLSHAGADITLEAAETLMKRVEAQAIGDRGSGFSRQSRGGALHGRRICREL